MTVQIRFVSIALAATLILSSATGAEPVKARDFLFTYSATIDVPSGQIARIWIPVPPSNEDQTVALVAQDLPGPSKLSKESKYGNLVLYIEAKSDASGRVPLSLTYRVQRKELRGDLERKTGAENGQIEMFLKPDARVPIGGKPLALIADQKLPNDSIQLARLFFDIVNNHMRYSKDGTGWGNGDAEWACDSKYGNCSDFHSLFISLARSHKLPAKFEIGFPLPEKRGNGEIAGYHCWAKFKPEGRGWIPVDISEANKNPKLKDYYFGNLTEDRIAFSVGRDLILTPKQDGPPLNFFVYPYVEVNGQPLSAGKLQKRFDFRDVEEN